MTDVREELIALVGEVRTHLEFQRALGVKSLEEAAQEPDAAPAQAASVAESREPYKAPAVSSGPAVSPGQTVAGEKGLEAVREALGECTRCKLHKGRNTIVFGEGNERAALLFVGEGPGSEEDREGRPFVGAAGQLLTRIIENGMKLRRSDVYICNVVKCRPPENRNPEQDEIDTCGIVLKEQIKAINPRVIVTLGNIPAHYLLGTREGITRLRGRWHSWEGIPVMPTFHPAYLLRNEKDKALVWEDIKKVMAKLSESEGE